MIAELNAPAIQTVLDRLNAVKATGANSWQARCPAHEDRTASLSVSTAQDGRVLVHCHAGCEFEAVLSAMGLSARDLAPANGKPHKPQRKADIVCSYDYHAPDGTLLYQVVRMMPKSFRQRRPDGRGGWVWNLQGVERVLYRLPEVLETTQAGGVIFVVEGERDADNLARIGLCATCNPMGAGKWHPNYATFLAGASKVAIIPDNDAPGREHAADVARSCHAAGLICKVIELPGLTEKQDVSDWIKAGGTRDALLELVQAAAVWTPETDTAIRPVLSNFEERDGERCGLALPTIAASIFEHTDGWPKRTGRLLFCASGGVVRWLDAPERVMAWLNESADVRWAGGLGKGANSLRTQSELFAYLQDAAENFDSVEALPHEPQRPRTFYAWQSPDDYKPNGSHLDKLLSYFDNCENPADRILARAMFLTPAWGGDAGTRPAFIVSAADRGCGKSTLADVLGELFRHVDLDPAGKGDEKLVSRLLSTDGLTARIVRIDNLKGRGGGAMIESLITARTISGHRMYAGEAARPNVLTWTVTANTPRLSRDLADRAFFVRLRKPQYRPGWRDEVMAYATEHRDRILADIVARLQSTPVKHDGRDRWMTWVDHVLARAVSGDGQVEAVLSLNQKRRDEGDEEIEECTMIGDTLRSYGESFVPASKAAEMLSAAFHEKRSTRYWSGRVKGHIESGRLQGIRHTRTQECAGFEVFDL